MDWDLFEFFKKKNFVQTNEGFIFRIENNIGETYSLSKGRFTIEKNKLEWVPGSHDRVILSKKNIQKFLTDDEAEELLQKKTR